MSYCIVGAGPTGLSLFYILASNNYNVTLIEKQDKLGGAWKSNWIHDMYFSEHSPRVLTNSDYLLDFLYEIGIKKGDLANIYGNFFQTNLKIINYLTSNFHIKDYFIFFNGFVKYNFISTNITVEDWLTKTFLSSSAKKIIRTLSILISDRSDKTNVNVFFNSLSRPSSIKQFKEPNKWHELIYNKFKDKKNAKIYLNTEIVNIYEKNKYVHKILCKNIDHVAGSLIPLYYKIDCAKLFLCVQSNNILNILKNGNDVVRNNWISYDWLSRWCNNTYYVGFGFQLHFKEIVHFPNKWCWSCDKDWTIIILPVSNWLKVMSKDLKVKTVWSCCIVDMNTISSFISKTANECSKYEIIEECLRQINEAYKIPFPYKITTSRGLKKINNKWLSNETGYTKNIYGYLPMKGNIKNLFALGSFTEQNNDGVATFGLSIESSVKYLNLYEKNTKGFHKRKKYSRLVIFMFLLFFLNYVRT